MTSLRLIVRHNSIFDYWEIVERNELGDYVVDISRCEFEADRMVEELHAEHDADLDNARADESLLAAIEAGDREAADDIYSRMEAGEVTRII